MIKQIPKISFKVAGRNSIYLYSFIVGIVSGLGAYIFSFATAYSENLILSRLVNLDLKPPKGEFHFNRPTLDNLEPNLILLFFLPILGGLLVGWITSFCPEAGGGGSDALINIFHNQEGKMSPRVPLIKSLATIVTLSTGGSGGKEGPISQIGAGFGSLLAGFLKAGARARRTLLLAGTAGGLGAIFHAPLGGALTAVELVYKEDIESDSLVSCIIASVTAFLVYSTLKGNITTIYEVQSISFNNYYELIFYMSLGVICFLFGSLFIKIFRKVQDIFQILPIPRMFKPALGGLFVGAIIVFFPSVLGTGSGSIQDMINGTFIDEFQTKSNLSFLHPILFLFIIAFLKMISTSFTIGSGGSAGLFIPALFIGGTLGAATGLFFDLMFPALNISKSSFVLVGMGAFYSGIASAPIAGVLMVCEIIGSYVLLAPLMLVSILTVILNHKISIYRHQLDTRFKSPAHTWDMKKDFMSTIIIKDVFKRFHHLTIIKNDKNLEDCEKLAQKIKASDFIVLDAQNEKYQGIFSFNHHKIDSNFQQSIDKFVRRDIPSISYLDSVGKAMDIILQYEIDKIAIEKNSKFIGYIKSTDLIAAYNQYIRNQNFTSFGTA